MRFKFSQLLLATWLCVDHGICLAQTGTRPAANNPSVTKTFNDGQKEFSAGNYKRALELFTLNLKFYPDHNPSLIYYARCLYRLDRIPDAYQVFSRINPNSLDIIGSYEYALTFFWSAQYQGALYGFRRVPSTHPLSDLANYYGAIAAMKLSYYADAEAMMEKALVLPAKFVKSKKLYLRHIRELKILQEKQALSQEAQKAKDRLKEKPPANPKPEPEKATPPPAETTATPVTNSEEHQGLLEFEPKVLASIDFREQVQDFHGYGEKKSHLRITSLSVLAGKLFAVPPVHGGNRKSGLVLALELGAFEQDLRGDAEKRNVQFEDEKDMQRIITTDPTRELTKWGSVDLKPWLEIALPKDFWWAIGGSLAYKYPDFERENRTSSVSSFTQLGIRESRFKSYTKYEYLELRDAEGEAITGQHLGEFNFLYLAAEPFELKLNIRHLGFKYFNELLDGPTSDTRLLGDTLVNFPLGLGLGVMAAVSYQSQNLVRLPTFGEVEADGVIYSGKPYIIFEPFEWFKLEIYELLQKSTWQVNPDEAQETYEKNQMNYFEEFKAKASLNLLF